jgi:hypothetical protein
MASKIDPGRTDRDVGGRVPAYRPPSVAVRSRPRAVAAPMCPICGLAVARGGTSSSGSTGVTGHAAGKCCGVTTVSVTVSHRL